MVHKPKSFKCLIKVGELQKEFTNKGRYAVAWRIYDEDSNILVEEFVSSPADFQQGPVSRALILAAISILDRVPTQSTVHFVCDHRGFQGAFPPDPNGNWLESWRKGGWKKPAADRQEWRALSDKMIDQQITITAAAPMVEVGDVMADLQRQAREAEEPVPAPNPGDAVDKGFAYTDRDELFARALARDPYD